MVNAFPAGDVLELGVGHGNYLANYRHRSIVAIDNSSAMLQKAKKQKLDNTSFVSMDAEHLSFGENQFDYVVAAHVLSISQQPNQVIKEAIRVLKPKGKLILLNHFSDNNHIGKLDQWFQPVAQLFHFHAFFLQENLSELNTLKCLKAVKFGVLKNYRLLVFEK